MKCVDRTGLAVVDADAQGRIIRTLYQTLPGRVVLKGLTLPAVSKIAGKMLDSRISTLLIPGFVKRNQIDLSEYESCRYHSFNAFFSRQIREEQRLIDLAASELIAPCDSRLTVHDISDDNRFMIKGRSYSMKELVKSEKLARHYCGGKLLLFRLTVSDYHRYCYIDNGVKTKNYRIPGVLHTVNPIAVAERPIYKENVREFSVLKTENFGNVLMMEVGALLVGRIVNHHQSAEVMRGEEAGLFQYGGSTVIVCLEPGVAVLDSDILANSAEGIETRVWMGERIGKTTI